MLLFGAALWGLYWFPLRLLEQAGLHGLWAVVFIYLGASAVQLFFARRQLPLLPRQLLPMVGIGVSGAISGIAFSIGMIEGEVARVLLLFYLAPVWSVFLAHHVLRERLAPITIPALLLAVTGAALMLLPDRGTSFAGIALADLLGLVAGAAFALTNVQVRAARTLPGPMKNLAACWLVPPFAAAAALALEAPPSAPAPAVLGSLALGLLWMSTMIGAVQYGVSRLQLQRSSVLLLFELIVGTVSAALLAGEALGAGELLGGACIVIAGLAVAFNRSPAGAPIGR